MSEEVNNPAKPNCYECVHRGTLPGDCHSKCKHPNVRKLCVVGDAHGIRMGWFMWPWNFDPVWLKSCDGFTPNERLKSQEPATKEGKE